MDKKMDKYAAKIDKMRTDRGWSVYKLAQESDIPEQSINKWLYSGSTITLPLLEKICVAFGITIAEFFTEGEFTELTPERKMLLDSWSLLSDADRMSVLSIIKSLINKDK